MSNALTMESLRALFAQYRWQDDAACKGSVDHILIGIRKKDRPTKIKSAKMICDICPVFEQCRDWSQKVERNPHRWRGVVIAGIYYPEN